MFITLPITFLCQNVDSLRKAQEEVDNVLDGRSPKYEHIKQLKYITRCINESMRLYPHPPVCCITSNIHFTLSINFFNHVLTFNQAVVVHYFDVLSVFRF